MGRVTANEVRNIMDTDLEDSNLDAFIISANLLVTEVLAASYDEALLKEIERWLSAHFASQMDPMAEQEKMGDGQVRYAIAIARSSVGLGLNNTPHGQQVKVLDYLGILVDIGKRSAALDTAFEVMDA